MHPAFYLGLTQCHLVIHLNLPFKKLTGFLPEIYKLTMKLIYI